MCVCLLYLISKTEAVRKFLRNNVTYFVKLDEKVPLDITPSLCTQFCTVNNVRSSVLLIMYVTFRVKVSQSKCQVFTYNTSDFQSIQSEYICTFLGKFYPEGRMHCAMYVRVTLHCGYLDYIVTVSFGYILYCVCFNLYCGGFILFCNVWVCVYVWVL